LRSSSSSSSSSSSRNRVVEVESDVGVRDFCRRRWSEQLRVEVAGQHTAVRVERFRQALCQIKLFLLLFLHLLVSVFFLVLRRSRSRRRLHSSSSSIAAVAAAAAVRAVRVVCSGISTTHLPACHCNEGPHPEQTLLFSPESGLCFSCVVLFRLPPLVFAFALAAFSCAC